MQIFGRCQDDYRDLVGVSRHGDITRIIRVVSTRWEIVLFDDWSQNHDSKFVLVVGGHTPFSNPFAQVCRVKTLTA